MQTFPSETFWAPVLALEAASHALKGGSQEAAESIRRIAGRIAATARSAGLDRAATAASLLQTTPDAELASVLDAVLEFIRGETQRTATTGDCVLVVEDDRLTATMIRDAISSPEWEVIVARTSAEAARLIAERDISVILLDLVLPDADGRDLLVQLRNSARTAWTPVIVLTGKNDTLTQSECYALGADGYLHKPIDWDVLKSAVSSKLQRSQQLHREVHLDSLTLLPNRAAFWDAFARSLAARNGAPLSVAMIDLDGFKAINETYGQKTGDEVLRIIARALSNSLRGRDFLARWGGEEFCIFMPYTPQPAALRVLNGALQRVSQTVITAEDGRQFSVTFSAGVATVEAGIGGGDALAQADRNLYLAKSSGRNQVLCQDNAAKPGRPRVLVAGSDEAANLAVQRMLEREGLDVARYRDGAAALAAAAELDFALAVIDVGMLAMDGFELVRHLRRLPKYARIPVVMLTGAGGEADIIRGFELGVSDYVVKPFNKSEFVPRIWRLLKTL